MDSCAKCGKPTMQLNLRAVRYGQRLRTADTEQDVSLIASQPKYWEMGGKQKMLKNAECGFMWLSVSSRAASHSTRSTVPACILKPNKKGLLLSHVISCAVFHA